MSRKAPRGGPSCVSRSCLGGVGRLIVDGGVASAPLALPEPVAVAVHFQDMDVVGQPIEQGAGQAFGCEYAGPFVERQIAGDDGAGALVTLAEHLEQQLAAGLGERHVAEFVDISSL